MPIVKRYFLEIKKDNFKKDIELKFTDKINIYFQKEKDIDLNKFFYRQIGKEHFWRDRLLWSDKEWLKYIGNLNLEIGIIKKGDDLIGFFEQEHHKLKNEIELIQMGILKDYQEKKLGSLLLKFIINDAFKRGIDRLWVHTCSLDHKFALNNYLSKGFKIFKEEEINFEY